MECPIQQANPNGAKLVPPGQIPCKVCKAPLMAAVSRCPWSWGQFSNVAVLGGTRGKYPGGGGMNRTGSPIQRLKSWHWSD